MKQLIINNKKSFDDFNVYIGERTITPPTKKIIKETVPFSNDVYDYSKLDGEIYWNEATLTYVFDIAELTTEQMEVVKSNLLTWLSNVHDDDIYDPYIGDYHYHGSYDSCSWEEDFGAGKLTVDFLVYPYKIANNETQFSHTLTSGTNNISVVNNGSHRITPTFICSENMAIQIGTIVYSLPSGTTKDDSVKLDVGTNNLIVTPTSEGATLTIRFVEEVF